MLTATFKIFFDNVFLYLHQNNCQNTRTPPLPSYRATPTLTSDTMVPSRRVRVALQEGRSHPIGGQGRGLIFWHLFWCRYKKIFSKIILKVVIIIKCCTFQDETNQFFNGGSLLWEPEYLRAFGSSKTAGHQDMKTDQYSCLVRVQLLWQVRVARFSGSQPLPPHTSLSQNL